MICVFVILGKIMNEQQQDLLKKHHNELHELINSMMLDESVSFTDPVLRELILIRKSYELIISSFE